MIVKPVTAAVGVAFVASLAASTTAVADDNPIPSLLLNWTLVTSWPVKRVKKASVAKANVAVTRALKVLVARKALKVLVAKKAMKALAARKARKALVVRKARKVLAERKARKVLVAVMPKIGPEFGPEI